MIVWLKYVPHSQLLHHLAVGWEISDELHLCIHGEYATLCVWTKKEAPEGASD